uniref:Uncharacterized protein n=1 Tax=Mola mola TaxID=94237 RepID=A0A3Q3XCV2_MOLML
MDAPRTGAFLLVQLLVPVSCGEVVFTEPFTCFLLDGVLLIFSIIATALYIREKVSYSNTFNSASHTFIFPLQELDRWTDAEPYQVLEPSKRKVTHFLC